MAVLLRKTLVFICYVVQYLLIEHATVKNRVDVWQRTLCLILCKKPGYPKGENYCYVA